jgi:hypothetical protein
MKTHKLFLVLLSLIVPLIYFTACSEKSEVDTPVTQNYDSPQYVIIDFSDMQNGIEDATLETDMVFNSTLLNYSFVSMSSLATIISNASGNPWLEKFYVKKEIGSVLRTLSLSKEQALAILGFAKTFQGTMKPLVQQFYAGNKDLIDAANLQRKAIADSVKNGLLTRVQALEKIKVLNQSTRNKIQNSVVTQAIKAQMCEARKILLDSIASVLTADQLTKWNTAVAAIPSPC